MYYDVMHYTATHCRHNECEYPMSVIRSYPMSVMYMYIYTTLDRITLIGYSHSSHSSDTMSVTLDECDTDTMSVTLDSSDTMSVTLIGYDEGDTTRAHHVTLSLSLLAS